MRTLPVTVIAACCLMWLPAQAQPAKAGKLFRDCPSCPEMRVIAAGSFDMGSPDDEKGRRDDGNPIHRVTIARFALGKTEVTRSQYAAFMKNSGHLIVNQCRILVGGNFEERNTDWREPGFLQNKQHPVTCISWNDAQAYVKWLSRKTGKTYRLPTEAEWEYAARGKTVLARYWGADPDKACKYANTADVTAKAQIPDTSRWRVHNCTDGFAYTSPAGKFKANAYGLHDMLGNVWEWVEDNYHDNYEGAPADGSAWAGTDEERVLRGGSWYDAPRFVRVAGRDKAEPEQRYANFGFRVARKLP